jgi:hypothetical protein
MKYQDTSAYVSAPGFTVCMKTSPLRKCFERGSLLETATSRIALKGHGLRRAVNPGNALKEHNFSCAVSPGML